MAKGPAKISVACPYCGATQKESEHARSTFCRKCGKHIELGKPVEPGSRVEIQKRGRAEEEEEEAGLMDRLKGLFVREKFRHVNCLHCNASQKVSSLAKSGSCVQCGTYLDFRDFKIDSNFSKGVETHGIVTITKSGELTSPKVACAAAIVMGKVNGNLVCSTYANVFTKGRVLGSIQARHLVIERKADVEFVRPLRVGTVEINGKISARIFADSVTINKHGALEGAVTAKSIKIDRGGIFHGDLFIGQQKEEQAELPLADSAKRQRRRDLGSGGNPMMLRPAT
jgi:cytoskeletal protein CcmA (bactofilin family)/endogenous inhibitor of DNA gyrase (YacG/DUF329 family)